MEKDISGEKVREKGISGEEVREKDIRVGDITQYPNKANETKPSFESIGVKGSDLSDLEAHLRNFLHEEIDNKIEGLNNKIEGLSNLRSLDLTAEKPSSVSKIEPLHSTVKIWERGDRAIAIASGTAVLGGLIAQVPGAIIGGITGALFGFFVPSKKI